MDILNYCILSDNGHILTIPSQKDYKIGKDEYKDFKQALLNIKATWEGKQEFHFPYNATNVIELLKAGQVVDFRKLQLFPTPIDLAAYMWECLVYQMNFPYREIENMKVLEPGAGTGNLIKYLRNVGFKSVDYCEVCPEFDYILKAETAGIVINKVGTDFLKLDAKNEYDLVFANPPFGSDTKHLTKMLECVKEGGYVCTLMGEGFYKKHMENDCADIYKKYPNIESQLFLTGTPRCNDKEPDEWIFESTPAGYSLLIVRKCAKAILAKEVKVAEVKEKSVKSLSKKETIKQAQTTMF